MTDQNPLGLDGFAFAEFTSPDPAAMAATFEQLGFVPASRHPTRDIVRYKQGRIDLLLNAEPTGQAAVFRAAHGPSACGMAFRVADPATAYARALENGARPVDVARGALGEGSYAIEGIGGAYLYLVERGDRPARFSTPGTRSRGRRRRRPPIPSASTSRPPHPQRPPRRDEDLVDLLRPHLRLRGAEIFRHQGPGDGPVQPGDDRADKAIRIPLNESQDENSQIEEYLREYGGEGIQHLALSTDKIYETVEKLRARGVRLQDTNETYFEMIDARVPGHGEDVPRLRANRILIDGDVENDGILLQIFTENLFGPIFFEIISARAMKGSASATSPPCSNRSNSTRSAGASSRSIPARAPDAMADASRADTS
jgi:4-hydroxyphenylpyruvate dioxygenase